MQDPDLAYWAANLCSMLLGLSPSDGLSWDVTRLVLRMYNHENYPSATKHRGRKRQRRPTGTGNLWGTLIGKVGGYAFIMPLMP